MDWQINMLVLNATPLSDNQFESNVTNEKIIRTKKSGLVKFWAVMTYDEMIPEKK